MQTIDITYVEPGGSERTVSAQPGLSLMETARDHGVEGIEGICGGNCSCATCHVRLQPEVYAALAPPSVDESVLLAELEKVSATSRLGCQIPVSPLLQGARVEVVGS